MNRLYILYLFTLAVAAKAQYLPNGNFEAWKNENGMGSTYQSSGGSMGGGNKALGLRKRPGSEPVSWNGSSVNQKVVMQKKNILISRSKGFGSASAVKLENDFVGVFGIGSNAPSFINLGTPWIYAIGDVDACDGGVYGGVGFSHRPDAITGIFKRSGGTGENAHIIAYIWNGTFKSSIKSSSANNIKDDVERAVLGMTGNVVQKGTLIASCDFKFSNTTNGGWQRITVPLNYVPGTDNVVPEKMNVIISSADYWNRDNIQEGSVLEVDNLQFVYYSEIASLVYDGVNLFSPGKVEYTVNGVYDPKKLVVTSNGKGAKIEKVFDKQSGLLTITIKGGDFASNNVNRHIYKVFFTSKKR